MSRGPFITLWTGRRWHFTQPAVADVHAADWHALAHLHRYGAAAGNYSVLEHMVRGVWLAERLNLPVPIRLGFGVHDVPEVVPPGDVLGPVVAHLKKRQAETGVADPVLAMRSAAEAVVYEKCGVLELFQDPESAFLVHRLDVAMLAAEKRDMLRGWADAPLPEWAPRERIAPMPSGRVLYEYHQILERYAPALAAEFRDPVARST